MLVEEALDILAARLENISGLTVLTNPAVTIVPPMAVVEEGNLDFNESFRPGAALMDFTVTVYVARADSTSGLTEARGYLSGHGDTSVRAALEDNTDDDLKKKVKLVSGTRDASDNYITAVFNATTHLPGAVAT